VLKARGTGQGQFVDVVMLDAILALSERIVQQFHLGGALPKPEGNRSPDLSPTGFLPAKDGFIAIGANHQDFFRNSAGRWTVLNWPRIHAIRQWMADVCIARN
jgi:crotonobetainyl-CoA:carnitine CoA-transferase CaiB-like acyl-CoA transferase